MYIIYTISMYIYILYIYTCIYNNVLHSTMQVIDNKYLPVIMYIYISPIIVFLL